MDYKQALSLLELKDGFTEEELKKNFRKLAAKYHPDVNKDPGSEEKSKQISEAFNFLKDENNWKRPNNPFVSGWKNWSGNIHVHDFDLGDLFNHFRYAKENIKTIDMHIKISFEESVKGTSIEVPVEFDEECSECPKDEKEVCNKCNGSKSVKRSGKWKIALQPGTENGTIISQIQKIANKNIRFNFNIEVENHKTLRLEYPHVFSELNITLLDALTGCKLPVDTVDGKKEITLPSKIKNGTNVIVRGAGVPGIGNHIIKINVDYPENTDDLINFLKSKE